MKIKKTVENGIIELTITDIPKLPKNTRIHGDGYIMMADGEFATRPDIKKMTLGDFEFDPRSTIPGYYKKTDSAKHITDVLRRRFAGFFDALAKFEQCHTDTAETITEEQVMQELKNENRLYYRNKKGQIKALDI